MKRSVGNSSCRRPRPDISKEILGFGCEDLGDGIVDNSFDSARGVHGGKDHETTNLKDILRKKLQEKQQNNTEKSEDLDQLESWRKEFSAADFRVDILHLTSKHCPPEDSGPTTHFPDRMLVLYDHQIGSFHPDRFFVHVNGD